MIAPNSVIWSSGERLATTSLAMGDISARSPKADMASAGIWPRHTTERRDNGAGGLEAQEAKRRAPKPECQGRDCSGQGWMRVRSNGASPTQYEPDERRMGVPKGRDLERTGAGARTNRSHNPEELGVRSHSGPGYLELFGAPRPGT